MGASGWVHIDGVKIIKETEKAFLCRIPMEDDDPRDEWIPKGQMSDPDDLEEGDEDVTISITEWIAKEKELGDGY